MNLFDVLGDDVVIHADMLAIPQFEKVWKAFEDKNDALRILKYVILNNHPLSNYVETYTTKDRAALLKKELLEDLEYDEKLLEETENKFIEEILNSLKIKLLRKLRGLLESAIEDIDAGKLGLEDAIDIGPKVDKLIRSILVLEKDVKLELSSKSSIKGGYKLGLLEKRRL